MLRKVGPPENLFNLDFFDFLSDIVLEIFMDANFLIQSIV